VFFIPGLVRPVAVPWDWKAWGGACRTHGCVRAWGGKRVRSRDDCGFDFLVRVCAKCGDDMAQEHSRAGGVGRVSSVFAVVCLLGAAAFSGCETPASTAIFYLPYTTHFYPPKPRDAVIPILGRAPDRPHEVIGRLAFSTGRGWRFLRESILYNARANGADAVILRETTSRRQLEIVTVPPRFTWIPLPGPVYRTKKGTCYGGTQWIPDFRPGYTYPATWMLTGIDAEMIVFKR
jgi:hypothetical protein